MERYLYNGVELPALPEWDKENYPYAYITHTWWGFQTSVNGYYVWYCNKPVHAKSSGDSYTFASLTPVIYIRHKYDEDSGEWVYSGTNLGGLTENTKLDQIGHPVWCNTDMYKLVENDSDELEMTDIVALAASDPVPVGGEPVPAGTPTTPYVRKNEAWQKQDAYKRVGSQWVKQAQDGYQAQGGQWSPL